MCETGNIVFGYTNTFSRIATLRESDVALMYIG